MQPQHHLAWLDLEMTGLDPETDTILEIAVAVTDSDLNVIEEGPCMAVHQPDEALARMDAWCVNQHGKSGLTQRVRESAVTMAEAQAATLEFVARHCPERKSPLCGNTIGQDRRFLVKYMPRLHDFFHYRSIDVSTVKELVARWYPGRKYIFQKAKEHQAMSDIRASIAELAYYREFFFRRPEDVAMAFPP